MSSAVAGPRFAPQRVDVERRADGSTLLRSPDPLRPFARAVGEWLVQWAWRAPERCFLAQRAGDDWRRVTYAEAIDAVRRIGASLLARGLTAATPVAVLSDNSIDHALLALGAMHVGIPVAPISPAYSLLSKDHAKLKSIFELLRPGLVFAEDEQRFAPALAAVGATATPIGSLLDIDHRNRADEAFAAIGPDTVAKILFTSGSTGMPKGVINTQRMLCSNQQSWAQVWPFLEEAPPGRRTCMLSGWGSTETAPLATCVHFPVDGAGVVGNPAPGVELKLVPSAGKLEVRVKGPNVTPGYYGGPDLTREAFDDEGFYKIGDAMRFVDGEDAAKGLAFDGRVAEDFKIQSGTWVHAGSIRVSLIAACNPLIQDAVITGHDKPEVGALVWVNHAAARSLGLDGTAVRARLRLALAALCLGSTGGSTAPSRLLVLDLPPSIDEGEITDKGYINQRAVLERRAMHVEHLHAGGSGVIWAE